MATRLAEYQGDMYEVETVAEDFITGQSMVIVTKRMTVQEILDNGCTYGAVAKWVISIENFREMFTWVWSEKYELWSDEGRIGEFDGEV